MPEGAGRRPPARLARVLAAVLALAVPPATAETDGRIEVLVQQSPLAGSQYYALSSVWSEIRPGDRLSLIREPENRHDANAVRVEWNGRRLGYVPRAENRALAAAMDRGERVEARVRRLKRHRDPWQRVEFEVYLRL